MSNTAIKVRGVSKRYRIGLRQRADTLAQRARNALLYPVHNFRRIAGMEKFSGDGTDDASVFWALRDIDFDVSQGDVVGIIGHNGAGKSTLLKVLSRITDPTAGRIEMRGRVSSLLEVGTGFHPELTGRDNVYMNGTILGMSKREIDNKFDEIVDFSGVEQHIDTAVKFYSSGMKVRLGFSVAAHLEPEILIIDEVLAVGDLAFQAKCLEKMDSVSQSGRTVLFVSHNMAAVEGLCTRCLLVHQGRITFDGNTAAGIDRYRETTLAIAAEHDLRERTDREGSGGFRFTSLEINGGETVRPDKPVTLRLGYRAGRAIPNLQVAIKICRNYREVLAVVDSKAQGATINVQPGEGRMDIIVPHLSLLSNTYSVDLWAGAGTGAEDKIFGAGRFTVEDTDVYGTGNTPQAGKHGFLLLPKCSWTNESD